MSEDQSRREALRGALAFAAGVTAAVAATATSRTAHAQVMGEVNKLRELQTAEFEAVDAYRFANGRLADAMPMDPLESVRPNLLLVGQHFRAHHQAHAERLGELIVAAGGTAITGATINFTPPVGFAATVTNIIKLATNKEKAAAIAYADALKTLSTGTSAQVVAAIGGVETQHFIVLHLLAKGVVVPGPMLMTMVSQLIPTAFVAAAGGTTTGLETIPDFPYAPNPMMP